LDLKAAIAAAMQAVPRDQLLRAAREYERMKAMGVSPSMGSEQAEEQELGEGEEELGEGDEESGDEEEGEGDEGEGDETTMSTGEEGLDDDEGGEGDDEEEDIEL
jgi:hypothetical protein